jgi:hypothetical protein
MFFVAVSNRSINVLWPLVDERYKKAHGSRAVWFGRFFPKILLVRQSVSKTATFNQIPLAARIG